MLLLIKLLLPFHIPTHFRSSPVFIQVVGLTSNYHHLCASKHKLNISITADLWQYLDTEGNTARCISAAGFMSGLGDNSGRGFISQGFAHDEIQRQHGISESLILRLHITL